MSARFPSLSVLALAVATAFAPGCRQDDDDKGGAAVASAPGGSADATAKQRCGFGIVNGRATSAFPEVGLLAVVTDKNIESACTATWVSDSTMITASHCVKNTPTGNVVFLSGDVVDFGLSSEKRNATLARGVASTKVIIGSPEFTVGNLKGGIALNQAHRDLAAVIFPKGTAPKSAKIYQGPKPMTGADVHIIGYGDTAVPGVTASKVSAEDSVRRQKRIGENALFTISAEFEASDLADMHFITGRSNSVDEDKKDSVVGHGDSGGPLMADGVLIGIASIGAANTPELKPVFDFADATGGYADITSSFAKEFFDKATKEGAVFTFEKREAPIGPSACGG